MKSAFPQVQRLLSSGGVEVNQVPVDRRKFNGPKQCPKTISADAFFNHYYHNVASRQDMILYIYTHTDQHTYIYICSSIDI